MKINNSIPTMNEMRASKSRDLRSFSDDRFGTSLGPTDLHRLPLFSEHSSMWGLGIAILP